MFNYKLFIQSCSKSALESVHVAPLLSSSTFNDFTIPSSTTIENLKTIMIFNKNHIIYNVNSPLTTNIAKNTDCI